MKKKTWKRRYKAAVRGYKKIVDKSTRQDQIILELKAELKDLRIRFVPCPDNCRRDDQGRCVEMYKTGRGFMDFMVEGPLYQYADSPVRHHKIPSDGEMPDVPLGAPDVNDPEKKDPINWQKVEEDIKQG